MSLAPSKHSINAAHCHLVVLITLSSLLATWSQPQESISQSEVSEIRVPKSQQSTASFSNYKVQHDVPQVPKDQAVFRVKAESFLRAAPSEPGHRQGLSRAPLPSGPNSGAAPPLALSCLVCGLHQELSSAALPGPEVCSTTPTCLSLVSLCCVHTQIPPEGPRPASQDSDSDGCLRFLLQVGSILHRHTRLLWVFTSTSLGSWDSSWVTESAAPHGRAWSCLGPHGLFLSSCPDTTYPERYFGLLGFVFSMPQVLPFIISGSQF